MPTMALRIPKRMSGKLTPSHNRARKQEAEVAKRVGGRTTPASGALDVKGDVRVKSVARIECKTTCAKSFSVTREMVEKIESAAITSGELPALVVEFISKTGRPESSVALVPVWVLDLLSSANPPTP